MIQGAFYCFLTPSRNPSRLVKMPQGLNSKLETLRSTTWPAVHDPRVPNIAGRRPTIHRAGWTQGVWCLVHTRRWCGGGSVRSSLASGTSLLQPHTLRWTDIDIKTRSLKTAEANGQKSLGSIARLPGCVQKFSAVVSGLCCPL